MTRELHVEYFAGLREARGCDRETLTTSANSPAELYDELRERYGFRDTKATLLPAVNLDYVAWHHLLHAGDTVVFLQPLAGG